MLHAVICKQGNPNVSKGGLVSIFFQPNGTLGSQKPSQIPNMATSMGLFFKLNHCWDLDMTCVWRGDLRKKKKKKAKQKNT